MIRIVVDMQKLEAHSNLLTGLLVQVSDKLRGNSGVLLVCGGSDDLLKQLGEEKADYAIHKHVEEALRSLGADTTELRLVEESEENRT